LVDVSVNLLKLISGKIWHQLCYVEIYEHQPTRITDISFEKAFLGQLHLTFDYRDAKGAKTSRTAEPQAMLILQPLWYLVAWDPASDGFRQFRMDRISTPDRIEGTHFRRRHVPFEDDVSPYNDQPT